MKERIEKEKARGARLERKVLLHVSLNTQDQVTQNTPLHQAALGDFYRPRNHFAYPQDVLLDALSEKVAEVHRSCMDDRMTKLNTLEKLTNIEKRLSLLLQSLESIPEEKLELMKKIKDSERRTRYCVPQWLNVPPSAHLAIEFFTCKKKTWNIFSNSCRTVRLYGKNRIPWLETSFCFFFLLECIISSLSINYSAVLYKHPPTLYNMLQGAWRQAERAERKTERKDEEVLGEIAGWLQENRGSFSINTILQFSFSDLQLLKKLIQLHTFGIFFQSGKKLMPRYMPVTQRVKVSNMDSIPAQDEIHEHLFGPENTDW